MSDIQYFGIRHHGPGCARSLLTEFQHWKPDCVLIEGPPEAEAVLTHVTDPELQPPVALLCYQVDEPSLAAFHPFAVFSPEWQAIQWAQSAGAALHLIDLPQSHQQALRAKAQKELEAAEALLSDEGFSESNKTEGSPHLSENSDEPTPEDIPIFDTQDPLGWLAHAAGFADGESWWNQLVEEREHNGSIFEAIAEAMHALREQAPLQTDPEEQQREALREAWMRRCIREAENAGHARIAVVCGAWHVPALQGKYKVKDDNALLKGLPKVRITSTWVPWSYRLLSRDSGYGAGVTAPGWYHHLWDQNDVDARGSGWMARVARLLRESGIDCSPAHLIEAVRLSQTLSTLRGRGAPGLQELDDAVRSVICLGEEGPLRLIRDTLQIGDRLGHVPATVPTVPLQQDLAAQQRRLRLKPETQTRTLALDLRKDNDLARSHLLHRLQLLDISWGKHVNRGLGKGTFHEDWYLCWQPEMALNVIEASRWGHTIHEAATQCALDTAQNAEHLAGLAALMHLILLSDLPQAVPGVIAALEAKAALTGDTVQLLQALPPLANIMRYGDVRSTDSAQVNNILDQLILRAAVGLPLLCGAQDEVLTKSTQREILSAHQAIRLHNGATQRAAWADGLQRVMNGLQNSPLLRGLSCRLLLDDECLNTDEAALQLASNLARGVDPLAAAHWLEGFLNEDALVLLYNDSLWTLVDDWLCGLTEEQFIAVIALVRRSFSSFSSSDRQQIAQRAKDRSQTAPTVRAESVQTRLPTPSTERAARALPIFHRIMGLPAPTDA